MRSGGLKTMKKPLSLSYKWIMSFVELFTTKNGLNSMNEFAYFGLFLLFLCFPLYRLSVSSL